MMNIGSETQASTDAIRPRIQDDQIVWLHNGTEQPFDMEAMVAGSYHPPLTSQTKHHFIPKRFPDLLALPPKTWLIDQILGAGDLGMLYGPPGSGKTFIVVDLILAGCLGVTFANRFAVDRPLNIAYCAGEGLSGLPARFRAAAAYYGVSDLPNFTFYDAVPQLYSAPAVEPLLPTLYHFVQEWQARQQAGEAQPLDLLIIDPLSSATVGADENSSKDTGRIIQLLRTTSQTLGAAVLLVHHSNKQGTGERGSSALRGAMDCMLCVKREDKKFLLTCEKLKDGERWPEQMFALTAEDDSMRVLWDEPGRPWQEDSQTRKVLDLLKQSPGRHFESQHVAQALSLSDGAASNHLARLHKKGEITRVKANEDKRKSNRNPWLYYYAGAG
jgi:hypothetical protein